jgi:hypothetical protein
VTYYVTPAIQHRPLNQGGPMSQRQLALKLVFSNSRRNLKIETLNYARSKEPSHFSIPPQPRTRGKMAGWAYVYFVTDGEQVKIGHAVDAANRLRSLQCSHTRPLTILATLLAHVSVERLIHRKFHHLRTRGEWFRQAPELQEFIEMVRAGRDVVSGLLAPYTLPRSRGVHGRVRPFHNKAMKMEQSG